MFSVVMNYEGVTCATQYRANSVQHALQLWGEDLSYAGSYGLTEHQRDELVKAIGTAELRLVQLTELRSIWWAGITTQTEGAAVLHIVESMMLGPPGG